MGLQQQRQRRALLEKESKERFHFVGLLYTCIYVLCMCARERRKCFLLFVSPQWMLCVLLLQPPKRKRERERELQNKKENGEIVDTPFASSSSIKAGCCYSRIYTPFLFLILRLRYTYAAFTSRCTHSVHN